MAVIIDDVIEDEIESHEGNDSCHEATMQTENEPLSVNKGCIHSLDWTTGLDYWTGIFLVFIHSKVIFLVLHILSCLLSLKVKGLYKTFNLLL